jgi:putative glycosyltransferase (TIGR04372 family)
MVKRNFHVYPWVQPLAIWNKILPGGRLHHIPTDLTKGSEDIHGWLEQTHASLPFLPEEDVQAKEWLRMQGWHDGEPFVCLLVRDSSYLDNYCPNTDLPPSTDEGIQYHPKHGYGWSHLNFRDSDIATYVSAAEWLADQGVWVFRMGKIMATPIPTNHHRIIDYAFHPKKSDFLDIWLFAHCSLCISTGTGVDAVSAFYQRPILYLNYIPLIRLLSWADATHVPKTLVWQKTGIPLTLKEQFKINTNYYDRFGITIINMSSKEIRESVQEQWQRLQGTWVDTDEDIRRQQKFWEILKTFPHPDIDKYHKWIHPKARLGTIWLRSIGERFLE